MMPSGHLNQNRRSSPYLRSPLRVHDEPRVGVLTLQPQEIFAPFLLRVGREETHFEP